MAHFHCSRRTRIRVPNPMATLYYAKHVHIAQTQDSDLYSLFLYKTGIRIRVRTRVCFQKCK